MNKKPVFWLRVALAASIFGSLLWSALTFFIVQESILSYPNDLQHPTLWGTIAALCVLLFPIILAELYALSTAKTASRATALYRAVEITCWIAAIGAIAVPAVFSVTQDVGQIAIILFQLTAAAVFSAGALAARISRQSRVHALFTR